MLLSDSTRRKYANHHVFEFVIFKKNLESLSNVLLRSYYACLHSPIFRKKES